MQIIFYIMMVAILLIIGTMLQRLFNGPTIFDRMNALGVIGAIQFYYWCFSAILTNVRICMLI